MKKEAYMQPTLIVLAAGMGSRYGGLKQLDAFGPSGETIIDYSVFDAEKAGFGKVVFVIRESMLTDFEEIYLDKYSDKIAVDYVFQELDNLPEGIQAPPDRSKPWGTGHAVMVAADKVNEPFAIINADDFYGYDSFRIMANHLKTLNPSMLHAAMVGFSLQNTLSEHGYVSRGVCEVSAEGNLTGIIERTRITKNKNGNIHFEDKNRLMALDKDLTVSMNLMGFTPPAFELMVSVFHHFMAENYDNPKAEFYIPQVLDVIAKQQAVPVLKSSEKWFGVTYREDKPVVMQKLRSLTKSGKYPRQLWETRAYYG